MYVTVISRLGENFRQYNISITLQLGAMINVLPHFSTNIPFDIK